MFRFASKTDLKKKKKKIRFGLNILNNRIFTVKVEL